jgi:hypothetical protein
MFRRHEPGGTPDCYDIDLSIADDGLTGGVHVKDRRLRRSEVELFGGFLFPFNLRSGRESSRLYLDNSS